jgi:hypothetical protein
MLKKRKSPRQQKAEARAYGSKKNSKLTHPPSRRSVQQHAQHVAGVRQSFIALYYMDNLQAGQTGGCPDPPLSRS